MIAFQIATFCPTEQCPKFVFPSECTEEDIDECEFLASRMKNNIKYNRAFDDNGIDENERCIDNSDDYQVHTRDDFKTEGEFRAWQLEFEPHELYEDDDSERY